MTATRSCLPRRALPGRPPLVRTRLLVLPFVLAVVACLAALPPRDVHAQAIKPWVPPSADSLVRWAAESRARFQTNTGDSVGGDNYRAYDLVGNMGRRLLRSLGKNNLTQAYAIKPVLDSLGMETEICVDPKLPHFVLLMVRNPYKVTAHALGFLYWYRDNDLRQQGCLFYGGIHPLMRVWWTGTQAAPYSLGVVDESRDPKEPMQLTLFHLSPDGYYWNLIQYAGHGPSLGGRGTAAWVDVNGDERPELLTWVKADNDTLFAASPQSPPIIHERIFTEDEEGFGFNDFRIVPSPYASFSLFIRLLSEGNRAAASRLLADPAQIEEPIAAGWGSRRIGRAWEVEIVEPGTAWPTWLVMAHKGATGIKKYKVFFELKEGRWIISEWRPYVLTAAKRPEPPHKVEIPPKR